MMRKLFKKVIALTSITTMLVGNAISVQAASVWTGGVDTSWYTGDKKTYDIATAEQLAGLSVLVREAAHEDRFRGIQINLVDDIVLNDTSKFAKWEKKAPALVWEPIGRVGGYIGKGTTPFAGVFNGNGHTISGMYVNADRDAGLFSYTSGAVVKDLNLVNSYITCKTEDGTGAICGVAENSLFTNVNVASVIVNGHKEVGGVCGKSQKKNALIPFMQVAMMGFGVVINPVIFGSVPQDKAMGTYFQNCHVSNSTLKGTGEWFSPYIGGIIGNYLTDGGFVGCTTVDNNFYSADKANNNNPGKCGGLYGNVEWDGYGIKSIVIKDSATHGFKRVDKGTNRSDADKVPEM